MRRSLAVSIVWMFGLCSLWVCSARGEGLQDNIYQVGELKSKGQPFGKQLATARYLASDVAIRTATDAIHAHGAYGFGTDFPLERYFRDLAEVTEYAGSPLIDKLAVARHAFGIPTS